MVRLLMLLILVGVIAAAVVVLAIYNDKTHRPVEPPKQLEAAYKKEDVAWLYAQGLSPEEIELIAAQHNWTK